MYYEERIIKGLLHCRHSPNAEFILADGAMADVMNKLLTMPSENRAKVFSYFCTGCGDLDPRCPCWNDE